MKFDAYVKCRAPSSSDARILLRHLGDSPNATRSKIRIAYSAGNIDAESRAVLIDAVRHEEDSWDSDDWFGGAELPVAGWTSLGDGCRVKQARI